MSPDFDRCWRAVQSRDTRFDGVFVCAVVTTGIYCRPSCPGMPARRNVRFLGSVAQAQVAGFRPCKRCRPDAAPGSPDWDVRADVVGRALRLIADGVVDRDGVRGLAGRLGYTTRHLHRQMIAELGVGAQAVARARRAQTARALLETGSLTMTDVAAAAGFGSLRQFNDTVRAVFGRSPSSLRAAGDPATTAPGSIAVRLPVRTPFDGAALLAHLAAEAVPGVDDVDATAYRRSLRLPSGTGVAELRPRPGHVDATLRLDDVRDLTAAIHRCRRLLDLDADPRAVSEALLADDGLAPLVAARPGLRVPGYADQYEPVVRAVLRRYLGRDGERCATALLVRRYGERLGSAVGRVTRLFPAPEALTGALPLPDDAAVAVRAVSRAVVSGDLVLGDGADRTAVRERLTALAGPTTADLVLLRGLKDPDVFVADDPRTAGALDRLGLTSAGAGVAAAAERWRPWRSYALFHLWADGPEPGQRSGSVGRPSSATILRHNAPTAGTPSVPSGSSTRRRTVST